MFLGAPVRESTVELIGQLMSGQGLCLKVLTLLFVLDKRSALVKLQLICTICSCIPLLKPYAYGDLSGRTTNVLA